MSISAADVNKLRQMTGAGMMDCKKALSEANGDFEAAIDNLRKTGQKISANRSDRDAKEGVVIAKVNSDNKSGIVIEINCETDFVAKNADFVNFANSVADVVLEKQPASLEELKSLKLGNETINDKLTEQMGKIGEKIDVRKYEKLAGTNVVAYNHAGFKIGVLVDLSLPANENNTVAGKDVAMQIAAMNPIAVDKDQVDAATVAREIEIGKEQARTEGKPEAMLEKIALGKLNKFYKDSTLLNQDFVKDGSKTISQMLNEVEKGLSVKQFKRVALGA
jgi:elongation factor Ts